MVTRVRKHELTADDLVAVQLSNRQQHGEYVTYTALSSNGHDTYTVTLKSGQSVGCTCPATVSDCRHAKAAAFEEAWTSPVNVADLVGDDIAQDMTAHVVDSLPELAAIADEIVAAEHATEKRVEASCKVEDWGTPEEAYLRPGFNHNADYQRRCAMYIAPKLEQAPSGRMVMMR